MMKKEAEVTAKVQRWMLRTNSFSSPFEIKHTKRNSPIFPMKELADHQKNWLLAANTKVGCVWKIPDTGFSYNPFDSFMFKSAPAFLVIVYPRYVTAIHIRDIENFDKESLHEDEALAMSSYAILKKDLK